MSSSSKPKRVVVTGAKGRLGAALCRRLAEHCEVIGFSRETLELSDSATVRKTLEALDFDYLVNTAALTAVDYCEANRELAYAVNAGAAGTMAEVCRSKEATMMQVSTDFIFDGLQEKPYSEDDPSTPINVYGQSKLLGEERVLAASDNNLVVRVSWVFGPDKPGFPEWVLGEAAEKPMLPVVESKWACPTYSLDFAEWVEPIILGKTEVQGVLHLCNTGTVSWIDYARRIVVNGVESGLLKHAVDLIPILMDDLPGFKAPRPVHSSLDTTKFTELTDITPRGWEEAMREHVAAMAETATAQ